MKRRKKATKMNELKKHNISPKYFSGNTWRSSHKADPDTILAEKFFQRYR